MSYDAIIEAHANKLLDKYLEAQEREDEEEEDDIDWESEQEYRDELREERWEHRGW